MFRCGSCGKNTSLKEKGSMRTIQTRIKTYYDNYGKYQGEGEEIVREIRVCASCAKALASYPEAIEKLVKLEHTLEKPFDTLG